MQVLLEWPQLGVAYDSARGVQCGREGESGCGLRVKLVVSCPTLIMLCTDSLLQWAQGILGRDLMVHTDERETPCMRVSPHSCDAALSVSFVVCSVLSRLLLDHVLRPSLPMEW